jgi:outer membrane cobalamin receptor
MTVTLVMVHTSAGLATPLAGSFTGSAAGDTLRTGARVDSTATPLPDSTGRMSTPSLVGTIDRTLTRAFVRTRDDLHWIDFRSLGDILETFPGGLTRNQQGEGQDHQITFDGSDWRGIAFMANGRPLNDPATGIYNMYLFTPEYADRVEVVTGPRAFLYGFNAAGGAVNLVTKNYNSNKPFTKLDYSEGAYGYAFADGTFSQNISRRVNVTFGFQHQATDGRFTNSIYDGWISRAKIRTMISPTLNLILAHTYASTHTGLNGGIDLTASGSAHAFDRIQAVVRNPDAYEKNSRHDADLSLVGTFFADTANVSTLTLYYSNSLREYRDEENRLTPNGILIRSDHLTSWMGGLLTQNYETEFQRLLLGASVELRQVERSPNLGRRRNALAAAWVKEEASLGDKLSLAAFGRIDEYRRQTLLGVGADATLRLNGAMSLFGGVSTSRRVPNYQELFWQDSTVINPGDASAEIHRVAEAGIAIDLGDAGRIRVAAFHRTVANPIVILPAAAGNGPFPSFSIGNGGAIASNGINVRVDLRIWYLALDGTAEYISRMQSGTTLDDTPKLWAHGGIYFWHKLLGGSLELKAGLQGKFMLSHTGLAFNPEAIAYVPSRGPALGTSGTVDFSLIAHIGDAYIHLIWENLPDVRYFGIPFTPAGERALRFGISWEFLN